MVAKKRKTKSVARMTPGMVAEQVERLKGLFPEVVAEGNVDFDKLKATLGDVVDDRPERYSFTWAGKRDAVRLLQVPSRATLKPSPKESVDWGATKNVFIEGENLEVLKLLYKSYAGRVKMIYIDPPYNTGNDFIYPDNFADPLDTYLKLTRQKDAEGNPHEWATTAVRILKEKLADHLVNGIEYIRISDGPDGDGLAPEERWYEMRQVLDEDEVELFSKYIVPTGDDKSVYDLVPCDSEVERKFVEDLEARTDVKLYLKLPYWFTVPTPVGEYRPDWAIVMEGHEADGKPVLYLVSETKGSPKKNDLRPNEWRRIQCGAAHFGSKQFKKKGALEGVEYKVVTKAEEL